MADTGPTGATGDSTGPTGDTGDSTGPTYLITIDELSQIHDAIVQQETTDKQNLLNIFQPSSDILRTSLITWASTGFPANSVLYTLNLSPPQVCSDGQVRAFYPYALYLLGITFESYISAFNAQVDGVTFNFTLQDPNVISIVVSRS